MMKVSATFAPEGAYIAVGLQHLSRLSHEEVREMVCVCLMFGGKKLREEIKKWLNCDEVESVAQVIAPDATKDSQ